MLGDGRSGATGRGFRGCKEGGGSEPRPEDLFPSALWHGALQGGVVGVLGGAREECFKGVEAVVPLSPAHSPYPPHPATGLPQNGGGQ